MSKITGRIEPKPQDPELLLCQVQIKTLCDEILALKPENVQLTFWDIESEADPNTVQEKLRASRFGDLLLKDGESLSIHGDHEHYPDLGLYIGSVALRCVNVRAWGWEYDKHRIDQNGPNKPFYDVIYFPGEQDWTRQLDISLHYLNGKQAASQTITAQTGSSSAGQLPVVSRSVSVAAYAETGYEGHNYVWRDAKNASEIEDFVALAKDVIENTV